MLLKDLLTYLFTVSET